VIAKGSPLLRVRGWDVLYENNRSREMKRTDWFPAPNDLSSDRYVDLVGHEHGAAHFGVWNAILMVASRAKPRRGLLVKADGRPHTTGSIARVTRLPEPLVNDALTRLLEIGLLEIVEDESPEINNLGSHPSAEKPQNPARKSHEGAPKPREGAAEGKGTEHHHQEGNGKEKKRTRTAPKGTEPQGTERADEHSTTEGFSAPVGTAADASKMRDDADENPGLRYASPDDELKAIYLSKAGEAITIVVLDAIRVNLEVSGVSVGDFVAEVRKHSANEWRNPAGFLRDLSKRFRTKIRTAPEPVTAAEAAAKNYRCSACHSRTPGEGAVPAEGGKLAPCVCASPEWIAAQRARGVFPPETDP